MALPMIAMAAMAGGTLMNIMGTLQQGEAAEQAAMFNAELREIEGREKERLIRKRGRADLSRIRSAIGKAGVTAAGSPMEVIAESAANTEMDALNARFGYQTDATMTRATGLARKRASRMSAAASLLSGGAKALGTGAQLGAFG